MRCDQGFYDIFVFLVKLQVILELRWLLSWRYIRMVHSELAPDFLPSSVAQETRRKQEIVFVLFSCISGGYAYKSPV